MSQLLIHSMCEFSEIILDALRIADAKEIVEIGAEYGGMSTLLADYAAEAGGRLTSVDPAPKQAFVDWANESLHVRTLPSPASQRPKTSPASMPGWWTAITIGSLSTMSSSRSRRRANGIRSRCWSSSTESTAFGPPRHVPRARPDPRRMISTAAPFLAFRA